METVLNEQCISHPFMFERIVSSILLYSFACLFHQEDAAHVDLTVLTEDTELLQLACQLYEMEQPLGVYIYVSLLLGRCRVSQASRAKKSQNKEVAWARPSQDPENSKPYICHLRKEPAEIKARAEELPLAPEGSGSGAQENNAKIAAYSVYSFKHFLVFQKMRVPYIF